MTRSFSIQSRSVTNCDRMKLVGTRLAGGVRRTYKGIKMLRLGMENIAKIFKPAFLAGAALSLGGCMYGGLGVGISDGYYGDGYVNGGYVNGRYNCDPYSPFDTYYACDSGYGFANIGFGGGWYDRYYYPGYGRFVFDNRGYRHAMKNHHRRHWAKKRAEHGTHHARRGDRREHHDDNGARSHRRGETHGETVRGNRREETHGETARGKRRGSGSPVVRGNRGRTGGNAVNNRRRPTMAVDQPHSRQVQTRQAPSRPTRARPAARPQPKAARNAPAPARVRPSSRRTSERSVRSDRRNTHIE